MTGNWMGIKTIKGPFIADLDGKWEMKTHENLEI